MAQSDKKDASMPSKIHFDYLSVLCENQKSFHCISPDILNKPVQLVLYKQ